MKYIYLKKDLKLSEVLETGTTTLVGSTGIKYVNKALFVPGYGWVPCSKDLCMHFTNDPKHLVLVISEEDDINKPITSDIWVARTGLIESLGIESQQIRQQSADNKSIGDKMKPNVKAYNRMSARALVISENAVLEFWEKPKKDKNGNLTQEISFVCGTKQGYVSPAAKSILGTGTIDDFQYAEVSIDGKEPIPCILKATKKQ